MKIARSHFESTLVLKIFGNLKIPFENICNLHSISKLITNYLSAGHKSPNNQN